MSLLNSVFDTLGASFRKSFEDDNAPELPLLQSQAAPSPRVPPPITSTVLWSKPPISLTLKPHLPQELAGIHRRARLLEEHLHRLIDAQSESHLARSDGAGSEKRADPGFTSAHTNLGSSVSTVRRGMSDSRPISASPPKPKNLRSIRKQITKSMQQLASVKAEEVNFLTNGNLELQDAISQASHWSKERTRLRNLIQDTESHLRNFNDDHHRTLYEKASNLEDEIRRREEELAALKAQLRRIRDELSGSETAVEAEVASYKEDLRMLDRNVTDFLLFLPYFEHVPFTSKYLQELPAKRRTLHIAQQFWEDELESLISRCNDAKKHHAALTEGVKVWHEVVEKITGLELFLVDALMESMDPSTLMGELADVMSFVEQKYDYAVSKNWKLLITAIGAELEALRMGEDVVQGMIDNHGEEETIDVKRKNKGKGKESAVSLDQGEARSNRKKSTGPSPSSLESTRSPHMTATRQTPIHDNDDPDPELLISHQDTDTD